jgi:hypothetical protein
MRRVVGVEEAKLREALQRIHRVAIRESDTPYMSIPADPARDADLLLGAAIDELVAARNFKAYVHERLDAAGVPPNPEPEQNAAHGCRIEGRLNILLHGRDAALAELANVQWELSKSQTKTQGWQSEYEMVVRAVTRECGGNLIPKTHTIDSIVLTVRLLRDQAERSEAMRVRLDAVEEELARVREVVGAFLSSVNTRQGQSREFDDAMYYFSEEIQTLRDLVRKP